MSISSKHISVKGVDHSNNEDSAICSNKFIIVADGMGGECDGAIASKLIAKTISAELNNSEIFSLSPKQIEIFLVDSVKEADINVGKYVTENPGSLGMGSTVVIALFVGMKVYVCWCGDSRCFVYSPKTGKIKFTTVDHSYVQDLVNNGEISAAEAFTHPDSNIITRFVGWGKDYAIPECAVCNIDEDDIVILCSDGLTGYSTTEDIIDTITAAGNNPDVITKSLVQLALDRGSVDDITVVTCVPCMQPKWFERFPFRLFIKS